ncbi:glycosyltransferase family 4 protein [Clostridium sp. YIM B02505]|uniref:Glycosyltransferase family 4 protein n=1 Tax=Clostridium yunnanense TaxID=2800325 RepID=A0ABS1EUK4_9CLOT|nr:glycosyltransferase family 4 protein [Clostridium yunnanense]MBK1813061.1 glycosyltransferase family 4 protein [Clostridium yunnanense]
MIKILFLHAGAEMYGADKILLELLSGLDKTRFEPYVILPNNGPLYEEIKKKDIYVEIREYPILRRKFFNPLGIVNYISGVLKYNKIIEGFCKEKAIEIIHSNTLAVLEGGFVAKRLKIKHVWHVHEIIMKPKFMFKLTSYLLNKNADEIVVVSNSVKNHILRSCLVDEGKIKTIYNGVDNTKFNKEAEYDYLLKEFKVDKDDIVVGMVGRINSWKGQRDFILAIKKIVKEHTNIKAILIGGVFEGEEWRVQELKRLIKDNNLEDVIIMKDFRSDVTNIYNLIDIFVLPSTNPDPLPTVVLEAMASGKPIVAYRHGGVTEMVSEGANGLFAEVLNIDDLSTKILYLLKRPEEREEMGRNSLNRQKKMFSKSSFIDSFENLYEKILK